MGIPSVTLVRREEFALGPGLAALARWLGRQPARAAVYAEVIAMVPTATIAFGRAGLLVGAAASVIRLLRFRDKGILTPLARGLWTAIVDVSVVILIATVLLEPAGHAVSPFWVLIGAAAVVAHAACNLVIQGLRRSGVLVETVLIAGPPVAANDVAASLESHPELGLRPVVCTPPLDDLTPERIEHETRRSGADRAVLLAAGLPRGMVLDTARGWSAPASLHLLDDEVAAVSSGVLGVDNLWGHTVVAVQGPPQSQPGWIVKRGIDVVGATLALVLASPVMAVAAIAVRITSPGPVLFRQERIGLGGAPFTIYKFRSMPIEHRPHGQWNAAASSQPTRVGRFLRASSIDELPQLINVLRGEMSLVGPRPELPSFVAEFERAIHGYRWRHRVPAGITGWAQANGLRGPTSLEERVRFDNHYIDRWSLGLELRSIVLTVRQVLPRQERHGQVTDPGSERAEEVIDLTRSSRPPVVSHGGRARVS